MSNLEITILAIGLAIDAFSVAASVGPRCCRRWGAIRLAGSFGAFQALMPLLGAFAGAYPLAYVRAYDHWVAFGLLEAIGAKMIFEALRPRKDAAACEPSDATLRSSGATSLRSTSRFDPSCGWSLMGLSVATSIDAFGAGIGMQAVSANLWVACPLIGGITAGLTYAGAHLGATGRRVLGRRAELVGGLVLMGLGVRMLRI